MGRGRGHAIRRRGSTAVIAMLFLILFSTLAIGFFYGVTTSLQVAKGDQYIARAQLAAESGLQFVRYQLATLDIPAGTSGGSMAAEIAADLSAKLNGTSNLGLNTVTHAGNVITIPSIACESAGVASSFSGQLQWVSVPLPGTSYLRATVTGVAGTGESQISRTIQLDHAIQSKPTTLFNFGIASRGAVTVKNSVQTRILGTPDASASILSASTGPTSITTGNGTIDGDLAVVINKTQVSLGGGSVGGTSNAQLIRDAHISVVPSPSFPVVDTTPFAALATNTFVDGAAYQKNVRVPPNTNPRFNGGDVIEGILYVQAPNTVTFRGHASIRGIIVFENAGTSAGNVLDFKGNVTPSLIPATPEFDAIRAAATGWAILAPAAAVEMSGSVDGTVAGTIMAEKVTFSGSADLTLTNGSVVSLGNEVTQVEGKTVNINGTGANNPPTTGLTFNGRFLPDPKSYRESN